MEKHPRYSDTCGRKSVTGTGTYAFGNSGISVLLASHGNFASAVIMDRMSVVLGAASYYMSPEVNSNLTSV